jgi:hypothetical protein
MKLCLGEYIAIVGASIILGGWVLVIALIIKMLIWRRKT